MISSHPKHQTSKNRSFRKYRNFRRSSPPCISISSITRPWQACCPFFPSFFQSIALIRRLVRTCMGPRIGHGSTAPSMSFTHGRRTSPGHYHFVRATSTRHAARPHSGFEEKEPTRRFSAFSRSQPIRRPTLSTRTGVEFQGEPTSPPCRGRESKKPLGFSLRQALNLFMLVPARRLYGRDRAGRNRAKKLRPMDRHGWKPTVQYRDHVRFRRLREERQNPRNYLKILQLNRTSDSDDTDADDRRHLAPRGEGPRCPQLPECFRLVTLGALLRSCAGFGSHRPTGFLRPPETRSDRVDCSRFVP